MDSSDDGFYRGMNSLKQRKADLARRRAIQSQDFTLQRGMKNSYSNPVINNKYIVLSQNSGLDAFRQSTRESNVNIRSTLNQNYMNGHSKNPLKQQRDGYSSIEPTETMARRKQNQFRPNTNSKIFSAANELSPIGSRDFNTVQQTKKMKAVPKYHQLLNPGTLNLTDEQVKMINDMHNASLNVNLMQQQLSLQPLMTQQNPQFERQIDYPESRLSATLGKPPKPLQSKKQRLRELLNEGQFVGDSSAPITPAGQYFDRSQSWDFAPKRYVQRKANPIELWEYITGRMLEQYQQSPINFNTIKKSKGQILCLKWAKLARKMLAKHDGWSQIKIRRNPIDCWKQLLIKADKLKYLRLTSNKQLISKLRQSNKKSSALKIQGRWNKLIRGLNTPHYKWVRLIKGLQRQGYINPKSIYTLSRKEMMRGTRRLGVIGRWVTLINGIHYKHAKRTKHISLVMCGRWSRLARKIVAKDNKLRSLNVNGRWRWLAGRLLNKAKPPRTVEQRWKNLILAAQRKGYVKRKPVSWKALVDKSAQKQLKLSPVVLSNYKALISGALTQHRRNMVLRQMDTRTKSLKMQGRWAIFAKNLKQQRINFFMLRQKRPWSILARKLLTKQYAKEKNQAERQKRWKSFAVNQRWRTLLMKANNKGFIRIDPFKNTTNLKMTLKKKQQPQRRQNKENEKKNRWRTFVVTQRWRRLLLSAYNHRYIRLDPFKNVNNINQTLKAKRNERPQVNKQQEKKNRWKIFVINQRWRRLIMSLNNEGYIRIDPFKNVSNINQTLKAKNNQPKVSKSQEKKNRWRTFVVTQRWRLFLMGLNYKKYIRLDPFKNISNINQTLKAKQNNKETEKQNRWRTFFVTQRWRLLLMGLNNQKYIKLDPFKNISNINNTLKAKRVQAKTPVGKKMEKQNRWRTFVVTQRWRLLLMCMNNQKYIRLDPFKNISNINKTLKAKQAGQKKPVKGRDTVQQRWQRLAHAGAKHRYYRLNPFGNIASVTNTIQNKNRKLDTLAIQGRWNILIRGVLNPRPYLVNSRWKRLVVAAARDYQIRLNPLRNISTVIKSLKEKNRKLNELEIQRRWWILIRGVLNPSLQKKSRFQVQNNALQNWRTILRKVQRTEIIGWKTALNRQKKNNRVSPIDRWEMVTNKLLKRTQTSQVSWYGGFKVAKIRVLDSVKKDHQIELLRRWATLIHGSLRKSNVNARWLKLMIRYKNKYMQDWGSVAKASFKIRNKRTTLQCWQILTEKMQRKYRIGNPLLNSIMWKARIQKKWNSIMMRFMKRHKLSSTAFYNKIQNISKLKPKRPSVDERWKILVTQLNRKYHFKGINSMMMPDVNRMKIKKITVKDKGQLQQNIREGRRRLDNDY